jgi:NAD(P)-dependent dehydrogenase (short-subunit alcohol dehydrogenase family)
MNYLTLPFTFVAKNFSVLGSSYFLPRSTHFSLDDVPNLAGKVALVTGGSEGIGLACTHTLLDHDAEKVFVLSHRRSVFDECLQTISEAKKSRVQWVQCDLSKWDTDVIAAAKTICSSTDRLDIVINNAARGIMTAQRDSHDIDLAMSTNHIGHVVLLSHLLPLLKQTAADKGNDVVRVVNMASMNHEHAPSDMTFASLEDFNRPLGANQGYGRTKLAAILYTRWLADRLPENILVNATHPGVVNTAQTLEWIHEPYPILGYFMSFFMYPFKKSPEQGCISAMFAATKAQGRGLYINPPAMIEEGNEKSRDKEMGERLMSITMDIIKEKTDARQNGCPMTAT